MLSTSQLEQLRLRGWTRVSAAIDAGQASAIEEAIWTYLGDRYGANRSDRSSWPGEVAKLQWLRRAGVFDAFCGPVMDAISEQTLGPGWDSLGQRPQALLSFPAAPESGDRWMLPHKVWHFDLPARGRVGSLPAVRFFGFVTSVGNRGGGTLIVEGSHRLVARMVADAPDGDAGRSAAVRAVLNGRSPWFKALSTEGGDRVHRFMVEGDEVDGVRVVVSEMSGHAGDVVVMHPWVLHNIGPNVSDQPRMMMTHTVYARNSLFF